MGFVKNSRDVCGELQYDVMRQDEMSHCGDLGVFGEHKESCPLNCCYPFVPPFRVTLAII